MKIFNRFLNKKSTTKSNNPILLDSPTKKKENTQLVNAVGSKCTVLDSRAFNNSLMKVNKPKYKVMEIEPSKITSNTQVRWLFTEISRIYTPLWDRIGLDLSLGKFEYLPELSVWWEVLIKPEEIHFYLVVPDMYDLKSSISRQVMKTWKQCTIKDIEDYMPNFSPLNTNISSLVLKENSILSLNTDNPTYSSLDSLLNAKYYLKEGDTALLQIGVKPVGNDWNTSALETLKEIKETGFIPNKSSINTSPKQIIQSLSLSLGLVVEETMNWLGFLTIPGWEDSTDLSDSLKTKFMETNNISTRNKIRSEAFNTTIRVIASSTNSMRRESIIRALSSGFAPLQGDNEFVEKPYRVKSLVNGINRVVGREHDKKIYGKDILCSLELAKIVNIPDQKAQIEHYNQLSIVTHRSEVEISNEIFINEDNLGIPFCKYKDSSDKYRQIYFSGKNPNLLCMARTVIGEPNSGKTTFACNFALDAFNTGYGCFIIDPADGNMIDRILTSIAPDQLNKVKVIDLLNTQHPVGLGWNEAFHINNKDIIEDLLVEEVIGYIELVADTELNMRARQWVENAVKAVYTTPDATLLDVENMLSNPEYRSNVIPHIQDPQLKADWEYFQSSLNDKDKKLIYDEAWRRLAPVMRKKTLRKFILQKPKKNVDTGDYLVDIRKWMDEGYMVLVKANETLGETLQTSLVAFLLAKFNLAIVGREDMSEKDRKPCFLILDEPDHYIKSSERWRRMLTRYRKYHCGLMFMFHGWQQLTEVDKKLPHIIRKSGTHYIIFQTDEDNLVELKPVIEPEFKIKDLAKGMPRHHAVVKLKMYDKKGEAIPAFMAKALDIPENRYKQYNNLHVIEKCAEELGRPEQEVMEEIFGYQSGCEFNPTIDVSIETESTGEGCLKVGQLEIDTDEENEEDKEEKDRHAKKLLEHRIGCYLEEQEENGEELDEELVRHMDELLEEG